MFGDSDSDLTARRAANIDLRPPYSYFTLRSTAMEHFDIALDKQLSACLASPRHSGEDMKEENFQVAVKSGPSDPPLPIWTLRNLQSCE